MNAAGLIYYRNADTSIMNQNLSKNSTNTKDTQVLNENASSGAMSKSKLNSLVQPSTKLPQDSILDDSMQ